MSGHAADRLRLAERAAAAGGAVAIDAFRTDDLAVETKSGKTDVVTRADREAQARVVEVVRATYPADPVVGEEAGLPDTVSTEGPAWVVDPIDGTNNFVRGLPTWATSVAAVVDGEPVAAATALPAVGDTYHAGPSGARRNGDSIAVSDRRDPERGTVAASSWWPPDRRAEFVATVAGIADRFGDLRRLGAIQAELAAVADGGLEGLVSTVVVTPWDSLAGVLLVRRAGGTVTDLAGEPWRLGATGLVASNGHVHDELLATVSAVDPTRA